MGVEINYIILSNKIRLRRIELGYSQEYMAERLNISQNIYSKNERNIRSISIERLVNIAFLLKLSTVQLFEMED